MTQRTALFLLFAASAMILTLQVALAIVLSVLAQTPYFAISFAFLGLSAAGVYRYIRRARGTTDISAARFPLYLVLAGTMLVVVTATIKGLDLALASALQQEMVTTAYQGWGWRWLKVLLITTGSAAVIGFVFSFVFFALGLVATTIYDQFSVRAPKLYLFDLLGAASGCLVGTYAYFLLEPGTIFLTGALLCFVIALMLRPLTRTSRVAVVIGTLVIACLCVANVSLGLFEIAPNPNFLARDWHGETDCVEIWRGWNAYSRVGLIRRQNRETKKVSYVFAINQSEGNALLKPYRPNHSPVLFSGNDIAPAEMAFLLGRPEKVLVLFAGAGQDMLDVDAYSEGQTAVTGVEINPLIVGKAASIPSFGLDRFFALPRIKMVVAEGRSYLESIDEQFDCIVLSWSGASAAEYLGTQGYTGQYLYTKEAFTTFLRHLRPGGTLAIVNLNKLKVVGMVKAAFRALGTEDISDKIVIFDSQQSLQNGDAARTLFRAWEQKRVLVKKNGFTDAELKQIEATFKTTQQGWIYNKGYGGFPLYDGIIRSRLPVDDLLESLGEEVHRYLVLPTDDRPFVSRTFSLNELFTYSFWSHSVAILSAGAGGAITGQAMAEAFRGMSSLMLIVAGFVFVILPLAATKGLKRGRRPFCRTLYFFGALGAAFMLVEISLMQRFSLLVGNPIYAFVVVLASLLLATGLGSMLSKPLFRHEILSLRRSALLASLVTAIAYLALSSLMHSALGAPIWVRFIVAVVLLFPIGLTLGMLFPQGLRLLGDQGSDMVPWAWAMNGYMSVTGSALAAYLSVSFGFSGLLVCAAVIYGSLGFVPLKPHAAGAATSRQRLT